MFKMHLSLISLLIGSLAIGDLVELVSQTAPTRFAVKRREDRESWVRDGQAAIERTRKHLIGKRRAKNVILFVGDGMSIQTVNAARILEGQKRGESGEENSLDFENFPFLALSKTYSVNQQTPDSASTMTAIVTGAKTNEDVLSVDQDVAHGDYKAVRGNELTTVLELAEGRGLSTGVVTTSRLTHATPAACYAHIADRDWEADSDLPREARPAQVPDIARQLVEFSTGDGLEVALGGGRRNFLPGTMNDPEYADKHGERLDGRDLTGEWQSKYKNANYVWNKAQFDAVDANRTRHLLGLFDRSHMQYEHERPGDKGGEPSLSEMTVKAIDILSNNKKGYFLMVEGGRIDHGHHDTNAYRALTETIEMSNAVRAARSRVKLDDTLIIVTADHSHTFMMGGYGTRGNNILGLVYPNRRGVPSDKPSLDALGLPFTVLTYANGPGYTGASASQPAGAKQFEHSGRGFKPISSGRPDLRTVLTTDPNFLQESVYPLSSETHSAEDVAIYAIGPGSQFVHGVMEQNWIFNVMTTALGIPLSAADPRP